MNFFYAILITAILTCLVPIINKQGKTPNKKIISYKLNQYQVTIPKETKPETELKQTEKLKEEIQIEIPSFESISPKLEPAPTISFDANLSFRYSGIDKYSINKIQRPASEAHFIRAEPLQLIYAPKAIYPLRAKRLGLKGHVQTEFTVNEDGSVTDVKIIDATNNIFISPVEKVLPKYKFKPPLDENGKPTKTYATKRFSFED